MNDDGPGWAKGYRLDDLRRITEFMKDFDGKHVRGPYGRFNDARVADALASGQLRITSSGPDTTPLAVAVLRQHKRATWITDFRGERVARTDAGDWVASRIAYTDLDALTEMIEDATGGNAPSWLWGHTENERMAAVADYFEMVPGSRRVAASSELTTGWTQSGDESHTYDSLLPPYEWPALHMLPPPPGDLIAEAVTEAAVAATEYQFEDHYSTYNKAHTWSALSLRGYGDEHYIIKPAEMAAAWRDTHPEALLYPVQNTSLWDRFRACADLARWAAMGSEIQRVRLMRLDPQGGELRRHADIIDPDSGPGEGKVMRIHIPLITNFRVIFNSWLLDGDEVTVHMRQGEAWYLDTRKPHTAINAGLSERIHLVCDVYAGDPHREILGKAIR